ncbi:LOW QUALITY PROTEIN: glycosyltransferase [Bacillus sp. JCM 19046]|nr:glycosyltransferase [Bacillus sp. JCM 19045]GAF17862.1 LOW QUALITY PROTEIN: glycosyltransferase [Bacillus sp. JCM 19046]
MITLLITCLSLLFIWVVVNSFFLPSLHKYTTSAHKEKISILIPLRNEASNVASLVDNLKKQTYPAVEYLFLDDHSTDGTYELLVNHCRSLKQATILKGVDLPEGWVGKVHACHQLSEHASGDYLFFLDADIRIAPNTVKHLLAIASAKKAGLISGFPHFPVKTWLSTLLIPMQSFLIYVHLPLFLANFTRFSSASAAHGSFMFFSRNAYNAAGGHSNVFNSLTEDVHLMRNVKKAGERGLLLNNTKVASCFMYETNREVWEGFTKNSFPGIGRSYLLAGLVILFYSFFFIVPFSMAIVGFVTATFQLILPYCLTVIISLWINIHSRQKLWHCFLIPLASISLLLVLLNSIRSSRKNGFVWKGRHYQ